MGTCADQHFFEGAEKLLEVWFSNSSSCSEDGNSETESFDDKPLTLRNIPRSELERLVEIAHCQIVSAVRGRSMDAYVLSESSLFVSDNRVVMKTCGSTSLLAAIEPLMELAKRYCGLDVVSNVYYSRKNFLRPDLQPEHHKTFEEEVTNLEQLFDEDGAGYCLGRLNQDRWYLYTLNKNADETMPGGFAFSDQTLEVLMSDLDPDVMSIFTNEISCDAKQARKLAEMDKLFPPDTIIDDKLFEPCGYSMNGVIGKTDQYITIHITPESDFSYASFETNMLINSNNATTTNGGYISYYDLITRIIQCFKPGSFLITMFANQASVEGRKWQKDIWDREVVGYNRRDLQFLALPDGVCVLYGQYGKKKL
jgi:S-adenosylmethionine decarboxylase